MSNINDAQRLQTVLDVLHLSGNRLSKILNYKAPASVYHVLEGRNKMSPKMIEGIVGKFPQVNFQFLKNGKGEPILQNPIEQSRQRDLFGALLKDVEPSKGSYQNKGKYDEAAQLEILIENSKKTNVLLNAILEEVQHLNKKL